MFASRISRAAFALAIFIFTTDCCYGRKRDSKSRDAEVEILSSLKGNVFGRTRELKAKLRQLRRRARFGGELDFTDGFYLQAGWLTLQFGFEIFVIDSLIRIRSPSCEQRAARSTCISTTVRSLYTNYELIPTEVH